MSLSIAVSNVEVAARDASLRRIGQHWNHLGKLADQLSKNTIEFVNVGCQIGLALQGLCKHRQMHLSFFENVKAELPETLTFAAVQKFVRLANEYPGGVETLAEAQGAEQLMLQAAGLIESPHREGQQVAHRPETTPDIFVFTTLSALKQKLLVRLSDKESWMPETRASVREQIEKHKNWLEEVEATL